MNEPERNQPPRKLGRRRSTRVDRQQLPLVAARDRVAAILRVHDLEEALSAFGELTDSDYAIVRLMAREGAGTGLEPAIRYKAIAALASQPSMENLNTLTDLARFGEDFYVRGHALLALGQTGMHAHLPVIAAGLKADEHFEKIAAARAIETLTSRTSESAVRAHAKELGGQELFKIVNELLAAAQQRPLQRPETQQETASGSPPRRKTRT